METTELSAFYFLGAILVATLGTALTRFLPFFVFKRRTNRAFLVYLQETMPLLIMTLLVFFSLKDVAWSETYGMYEIAGILSAIICFALSRNAILSMFVAIAFYMIILKCLKGVLW